MVANLKEDLGESVVRDNDKRRSALDYKKRDATDRWSKEDTNKFYKALQLIGTDFGLIESLFEGKRSRNQIKVSQTQNPETHFSVLLLF